LAPLKNYNNIRLELELALTFDLITFLLELESYVPLAFRCRMVSKCSPMHVLHPLVPFGEVQLELFLAPCIFIYVQVGCLSIQQLPLRHRCSAACLDPSSANIESDASCLVRNAFARR